jgi:23S rRNA (guanine745-N1)-methyltransferase
VAKEGYINLTVGHSTKTHGDDSAMVSARRTFLSHGHYAPLRAALIDELAKLDIISVVDLGCGEGDYTQAMADAGYTVIGIDLSKSAIKRAAKGSIVTYLIANLTHTPLKDHAMDAAVSIFSPFDVQEVTRIASHWFLVIRPLPQHLSELKALLYASVRPNPQPSLILDGLKHHHRTEVNFPMDLSGADLTALLEMTPYVHTSPLEGIAHGSRPVKP